MAVKITGCVWLTFGFLRILWTCWPQTGYIHPDEFFQAPEITAGDTYNIVTARPWEFNQTFPVRSVVFPYLLTALPFQLLRLAERCHVALVNTKNLVVASRMAFCLSSFLIDYVVFRICRLLGIDPAPALCVLSTSFVTLVFYTRPFSNSTESILFALLLLLVISEICGPSRQLTARGHLRRACIGIIVTSGFWNRPTFLSFALAPLIGWMYSVCVRTYGEPRKTVVMSVAGNIFVFFIGVVPTAAFFTFCDSFYFGFLTNSQLVFTPLNFLVYNLNSQSLKEHGIHPRIMHLAVNMPLLYGPLAFALLGLGVYALVKQDAQKCCRLLVPDIGLSEKIKATRKDEDKTAEWGRTVAYVVLVVSIVVPVCSLSAIPHQEPRFIIPVLVPLTILFAHMVICSFAFHLLTVLWILWNVVGCTIFGVLHQGGMYPCMEHLQLFLRDGMRSSVTPTSYHVLFFHTYMAPQHLLVWPKCQTGDNDRCKGHTLTVHDLGGTSINTMLEKTNDILRQQGKRAAMTGDNFKVFIVSPSTIKLQFPGFQKLKQFSPHLSAEDPPRIQSILGRYSSEWQCNAKHKDKRYVQSDAREYCSTGKELNSLGKMYGMIVMAVKEEFSLNLYEISL